MKIKLMTFIVIMFVSLSSKGQEVLTFTDVVKIDSISKNELYNRAKLWFATTFNSLKDVLQIEDKDAGQLVGNSLFKYTPTVFNANARIVGNIKLTIKIFVKDGRYKYEFTNFIHESKSNSEYGGLDFGLITTDKTCPNPKKNMFSGWNDKVWLDIKNQIEINTTHLIESLKKGMLIQSEAVISDW